MQLRVLVEGAPGPLLQIGAWVDVHRAPGGDEGLMVASTGELHLAALAEEALPGA